MELGLASSDILQEMVVTLVVTKDLIKLLLRVRLLLLLLEEVGVVPMVMEAQEVQEA